MVKTLTYRKERIIINNADINMKEWFISTHNLFRWHRFHTITAKKERNKVKKENLDRLKTKISA